MMSKSILKFDFILKGGGGFGRVHEAFYIDKNVQCVVKLEKLGRKGDTKHYVLKMEKLIYL